MKLLAFAFFKDPEQKTGCCQPEDWVCSVAELGQAGKWQLLSSNLQELHGTPESQEVPHFEGGADGQVTALIPQSQNRRLLIFPGNSSKMQD